MAQCEPLATCIFFNDKMANYPSDLFPNHHNRAEKLVAEKKGSLT